MGNAAGRALTSDRLIGECMDREQRVLSREQLEQQMYSWGHEVESNAIEVHVHHLRKKLGSDFIKTRRGIGYTLGDEA